MERNPSERFIEMRAEIAKFVAVFDYGNTDGAFVRFFIGALNWTIVPCPARRANGKTSSHIFHAFSHVAQSISASVF